MSAKLLLQLPHENVFNLYEFFHDCVNFLNNDYKNIEFFTRMNLQKEKSNLYNNNKKLEKMTLRQDLVNNFFPQKKLFAKPHIGAYYLRYLVFGPSGVFTWRGEQSIKQ